MNVEESVFGIGPRDPDRHGDWVQSSDGRRFYPMDVRPGDFHICDLALTLSREPRWGGLTRRDQPAFSVAQHSVLVSLHCDPPDALWGLLHDCDEFIFRDLPSPLKHAPELAGYRVAQRRQMDAICLQFGLPIRMPASVKRADHLLLATEARDLFLRLDPAREAEMRDTPKLAETLSAWAADVAYRAFLDRFRELWDGKGTDRDEK